MKDMNFLNLFWAIVWAVALILAVIGVYWKYANGILAVLALAFCWVFAKEYVHIKRMK